MLMYLLLFSSTDSRCLVRSSIYWGGHLIRSFPSPYFISDHHPSSRHSQITGQKYRCDRLQWHELNANSTFWIFRLGQLHSDWWFLEAGKMPKKEDVFVQQQCCTCWSCAINKNWTNKSLSRNRITSDVPLFSFPWFAKQCLSCHIVSQVIIQKWNPD